MFKNINMTLVTENLTELRFFYKDILELELSYELEDNVIFSLNGTDLHIHNEQNEESHHVDSKNSEQKGSFILNLESSMTIESLKTKLEEKRLRFVVM